VAWRRRAVFVDHNADLLPLHVRPHGAGGAHTPLLDQYGREAKCSPHRWTDSLVLQARHRGQYPRPSGVLPRTARTLSRERRLVPGFRGRGGKVHRGRTCWRTRDFHRWCPIKAAVDKKKRVPGDQPIACLAEGRGGIPCARPIARKERWHLRQHRQHRLRPYWAHLQGWARARSTAVVANGICRTSGLLF
jgi:hypothetical protein